jgi:hypothetical protein
VTDVRPRTQAGHDHGKRHRRVSKRSLRAMAWVAGIVSFVSPWVGLGVTRNPVSASTPPSKRQVVITHKVIKRVVVWTRAPEVKGGVRYVDTPSSRNGGSSKPEKALGQTKGSHP